MANLSKEAKEDRQHKEMAEILKRSFPQYKEIEVFKEYEFSYCIAFEMARRNMQLRQRTRRFIEFYKLNRERIIFIPEDRVFFNKAFSCRLQRKAQKIFSDWYEDIRLKFWLKPVDLFYIDFDEIVLEMAEVYMHLTYEIRNQAFNEKFSIETDDGIDFTSYTHLKNEHFFMEKKKISAEEVREAFEASTLDASAVESEIKISDNFSRPKLSVPSIYNRTVQVELNLSLPEKELISYIEHVKRLYDKNKTGIKSAIELFGIELSDAGFLSSDSEQIYKKDRRKTMGEKSADLFFIYDCHSNNLSMDYAIEHLNHYWNEERNAFPEQFQQKTYKRYLKLAKDFIENRKYQSLLIGQ